jgi:hypothetical protein
MIRRQVNTEFWLIAQNDHAQISALLAGHAKDLGHFPAGSRSEPAILGIGLHDCGWPIHDDEPTLNSQNLPLDVFETPRQIAMRVWEASACRAAEHDPYAGLLVSLHVLSLSIFATSQSTSGTWDLAQPRVRFEVNRFQHAMIELQESLRTKVGLPIDQPLEHGLAKGSSDPREQRLIADFRWLQGMDQLSLAICCAEPPFKKIQPLSIEVAKTGEQSLHIRPWPLDVKSLEVDVRFRRVPAKPWAGENEFRAAYANAKVERFTAVLGPNTM